MAIQNILVPVDFSKCSKNALRVAIQLAKKVKAKIHLVNAVYMHPPLPVGGTFIESIVADYEQQVRESFHELETEVLELRDVPHEEDQFVAYLTDAIQTEVESKSIDLIVMGTREEHSGIEQLVGTNASAIIEALDVPVLTIPEQHTQFHMKRIGLASDFKHVPNYKPLDMLKYLAKIHKADIVVFHIADNPNALRRSESEEIERIENYMKDVSCRFEFVMSNSISEGIREFADSHGLDMLALMPRKHNILERIFNPSVTKSIAVTTNLPLFTVHA
jgi:nucleotide-binding universal stress UspA family protein